VPNYYYYYYYLLIAIELSLGGNSPYNIWTKCNNLTQQSIGISTTIDTWATCFDSYRVIFRPSKNTDPKASVFFEGLKIIR